MKFYTPNLLTNASRFVTDSRDPRQYLRFISIEPLESGGAHIVSTNGHMLYCAFISDCDVSNKTLLRFQAKPKQRWLSDNKGTLYIENEVAKLVSGSVIDQALVQYEDPNRFPDWKRLCAKHDVIPAQYNPDYLKSFGDAYAAINSVKGVLPIRQQGDNAAIVGLGPDAFGLLMPIRIDAVTDFPDWLK